MLSQFSAQEGKKTLANLNYLFPSNVYPVGRLDADSEGLLILTNDNQLNNLLLNPKYKHNRTYLVQVEGIFTNQAKIAIETGVEININGTLHKTTPAKVTILSNLPTLPPRNPPVRYRQNIPTSFITITLSEGKNRQVRRTTAKVGFPTLRLVRVGIEDLLLNNMQPGNVVELNKETIYKLLKI